MPKYNKISAVKKTAKPREPKSPTGTKRYHYKHYRRPQFTDPTEYYHVNPDGTKRPLTSDELEWLRKFQWDEVSYDKRSTLSKEEKKIGDHDQYIKRYDMLNCADIVTPDQFDRLNSTSSYDDLVKARDREIDLFKAEAELKRRAKALAHRRKRRLVKKP